MSTALVKSGPADTALAEWQPAMSIEDAVQRYELVKEFTSRVLKEGKDYGKIPGTGADSEKALKKPGAEKLCTFFGLRKVPEIIEKEEDWTGARHAGEPFFYYAYRMNLYRGDVLVAAGDGSCNSWEKKYRWRRAERVCPACGKATIIKGKAEYGGGWLCWKKPAQGKDGCGAKFEDGDPAIESQQVGRVPNSDPADVVNTIQKMALKRALVAATLLAVNASDYFTQDVDEELDDHGAVEGERVRPAPPKHQQPQPPQQNGSGHKPAAPRNGVELAAFLRDYEKGLVAEQRCKPGALLQYVREQGLAEGYSDDLSKWDDAEQIAFAGNAVRAFLARPAPQAAPSRGPDGVALSNWCRVEGKKLHAREGCTNEDDVLKHLAAHGKARGWGEDITKWHGQQLVDGEEEAARWLREQRTRIEPVAGEVVG